jgi:hypothetical protein
MSCCGSKRSGWKESLAREKELRPEQEEDPRIKMQKTKWFQYVGSGELMVTGNVTGKKYHFKMKGETLEVAYLDSFALMAENDLKSGLHPE